MYEPPETAEVVGIARTFGLVERLERAEVERRRADASAGTADAEAGSFHRPHRAADASLIHLVVSGQVHGTLCDGPARGGTEDEARRHGRPPADRGTPGSTTPAAAQPSLGPPVRRDPRLPRARRCGHVEPTASRSSGSAGGSGPVSTGAGWATEQAQVLVVGQDAGPTRRSPTAAFVGESGCRVQHLLRPPRRHPVVPLPQHVRVLDHRSVRRAPPGPGARPRLAHRPTPHPAARLRGRARRPAARRSRWAGRPRDGPGLEPRPRGTGGAAGGELHLLDATAIGPSVRCVDVMHPGAGAQGASTEVAASFTAAARRVLGWARDTPGVAAGRPGRRPRVGVGLPLRAGAHPAARPAVRHPVAARGGRHRHDPSRRGPQHRARARRAAGGRAGVPGRGVGRQPGRLRRRARRPAVGAAAWRPRVRPGPTRGDGPAAGRPGRRAGLARLRRPRDPGRGHLRRRARVPGPVQRRARCWCWPTRRATTTWRGAGPSPARRASASRACWPPLGITRSYLVLRTLPVDTAGLSAGKVWALADRPDVVALHRALADRVLDDNPVAAVVTVGPHAERIAGRLDLDGQPVVALPPWPPRGARAGVGAGPRPAAVPRPDPSTNRPTAPDWDGERAQIPAHDLPFGVPRWQGTSGDRVVRSKRVPGADVPPEPAYKVWAPRWVDEPSTTRTRTRSRGPPAPPGRGPVAGDANPRATPGVRQERQDRMPPTPVTERTVERYVLEGRVVTMNGAFAVLDPGRVYVDGRAIAAVQPADKPAAGRVGGRPVVRTGDTIYPGLIELHNHLSYNALPLWQTPQRFTNRGQWMRHRDYRRFVSGPAERARAAPAGSSRRSCATSRPSACSAASRPRRASRSCVEHGHPPLLQGPGPQRRGHRRRRPARRRPPGSPTSRPRTAKAFLKTARAASSLLLHLAEGVDDAAREHFRRCASAPTSGRSRRRCAGIHCAGLARPRLPDLAGPGRVDGVVAAVEPAALRRARPTSSGPRPRSCRWRWGRTGRPRGRRTCWAS